MKKQIYVIKNSINDKVYVGQSLDPEERFRTHCKPSSARDNSLIDKAIQKYGKENFWFEILEDFTEDYNEKEKYWIQKLNSLKPNGYNIQEGGNEPPRHSGDDHSGTKISDAEVAKLKADLANTKLSLQALADKYSISKRQVLRINQGLSRAQEGETYPIRKTPNSCKKLTEEQIDEILYLLEYTYMFNGQIAKQFGVEVHLISDINQGKAYRRDNVEYPIREWKSCGVIALTYDEVTEIIELLKTTNLSFSEIGRKYNVRGDLIAKIMRGTAKTYKRKDETYPLRKS